MATKYMTPEQSAKLAELLAIARASKAKDDAGKLEASAKAAISTLSTAAQETPSEAETNSFADKHGNTIEYNARQAEFVSLATTGESCILIGAAGTGKTTCMRGVIETLIYQNKLPRYLNDGHKHLMGVQYGVVAVSFTRRAVSNLRRNMPEDLKANCLTIHALLEYAPIFYTIIDPETGAEKETMKFEETRNAFRPLSQSIKLCIIDESSMVSTEQFAKLQTALPSDCQFIFLGDIQQLPPVFGQAILGYKMLELPTVELTEVYRQALESPIIRLAHRILSGNEIKKAEFTDWHFPQQLRIHPWAKRIDAENATFVFAKFLTEAIKAEQYLPEEDMVLIPFNKACGTIELNKHIAQFQARRRKETVWEVIAGFNKYYFSVGDKVLYDKEDAIITKITRNASYSGAVAQKESTTLDYWGFDSGEEDDGTVREHKLEDLDTSGDDDIDLLLAQSVSLSSSDDGSDRVRQCSHVITVRMQDSEQEIAIDSASDVNSLLLSYALTVHKSQGSEFRKVFLLLHQSHNTMLQRELLYTAVTRAKEELYVICEPDAFEKGIRSQKIKGNTLKEKALFFMGKVERNN